MKKIMFGRSLENPKKGWLSDLYSRKVHLTESREYYSQKLRNGATFYINIFINIFMNLEYLKAMEIMESNRFV